MPGNALPVLKTLLPVVLMKRENTVGTAKMAFSSPLMLKQGNSIAPRDFRKPDTSKQLWTLSESKVKEIHDHLSQGKPSTEKFQ